MYKTIIMIANPAERLIDFTSEWLKRHSVSQYANIGEIATDRM